MNLFPLNGSTLNGAGASRFVLAVAAVVCSTSLQATAVREAQGSVPFAGTANVSATAVKTQNPVVALGGAGAVFATPTHVQKSTASLGGYVDILPYVLRSIGASATFTSGVNIIAVVASTQGSTSLLGSTSLVASGTRIQAGLANASANGSVVVSIAPTLTKYPTASVAGTADVRGEPHINNAVGAYTAFLGNASVTSAALRNLVASGAFQGACVSTGVATPIRYSKSDVAGVGVFVTAEPVIKAVPISNVGVTAQLTAFAVLVKNVAATLITSSNVTSLASQKFLASSNIVGGLTSTVTSSVNTKSFAVSTGSAQATASALRTLQGNVAISGNTGIIGNANIKYLATGQAMAGTADMQPLPDAVNVRRVLGTVAFAGSSTFTPVANQRFTAKVVQTATAAIGATSENLNRRRVLVNSVLSGVSTVTSKANMTFAASATAPYSGDMAVSADALNTRRLLANGTLQAGADIEAIGSKVTYISAEISALFAEMTVVPETTIRVGQANLQNTVDVAGSAVLNKVALANIDVTANTVVTGVRYLLPQAILDTAAVIIADTIGNPDVYDPEDRTFIRPADVVEFVRPFIETEFKRAA